MEKIKGNFFLSESHKKKKRQIPGSLEIQDNGLAHLDLSGVLISNNDHPFLFLGRKQKVNIWGTAENGSKISLLDCFSIKATQHLDANGMSLEVYQIRFVLKNAWVDNIHSKYFNKISANIEGLDLWLNISGGKESISFNENNAEIFSYKYEIPHSIDFGIDKDLSGCFYFMLKCEFLIFLVINSYIYKSCFILCSYC